MPARKNRRAQSRPKASKVSNLKLQRWIDLLAALLSRHYGATASELRQEVPAYGAARDPGAVERMFERDKDELRAFGIPIEVRPGREGEADRYVVDPREMYLPYLQLAADSGRRPAAATRPGYRALPVLSFEPDELSALMAAAQCAQKLGDPVLDADATSAIRKLTFDLPVGSAIGPELSDVAVLHDSANAGALRTLGQAVLRRKRVSFTYRGMSDTTATNRTVEPYGLFFLSGHWYLAAHDLVKEDVRNFRVSRMSDVSANAKTLQRPDYEIPGSFRLSEHARLRAPWEMGGDDEQQMILEFRGPSTVTVVAAALGRAVPGQPRHRAFAVRRMDTFVRWTLSFAGEVVPVSPPKLVDAYREAVQSTLRVYDRGVR